MKITLRLCGIEVLEVLNKHLVRPPLLLHLIIQRRATVKVKLVALVAVATMAVAAWVVEIPFNT